MLGFPVRSLAFVGAFSVVFGCSSDDSPAGSDSPAGEQDTEDGGTTRRDAGNAPTKETGAQCDDGLDNDKNGKTDCEEPACKSAASCAGDAGPKVIYSNDGGDDACSTARADGEPRKAPVDVVWVIDDSFSMLDDIMRVQQNMASFAKSLIDVGLDDYHIVVLNEPTLTLAAPWDAMALGLDPARFFPHPVVAFNDCFTPTVLTAADWSADLRPDAALHFIMVTDDNSLMSWSDFKAQMDPLLGGRDFTVHAIVDPPQHCLTSTQPGTAYLEAAMATGGTQASICEADWTPTFTAIEDSIQTSAIIPCAYEIPEPSGGQMYDRTSVNVQHVLDGMSAPYKRKDSLDACASEAGWYYDNPETPTQVLLCPAACAEVEQQGGSINIDFVCKAQVYL